ncbi:4-hydroxy-L-threonine phosphate dehydrogenase PdxA, partial [Rhizobium metallidurans]|nr:4-hydroxy-L-threonine phosphate dehydrogenase PdxA [Rhizobium metallidurans]
VDGILSELELTLSCLKASGIASPKVAVAGLNRSTGDGGSSSMTATWPA